MGKMLKDNLIEDDIYEGNIFDFEGEKLLLIESEGVYETYINEDYAPDDQSYGYDDTVIYAKQRWKVDVLPPDIFSKTFTTSRTIHYLYSQVMDLETSYSTMKDVRFRINGSTEDDTDAKDLLDNFVYNMF